jgi:hypothetical protein
LFGADGTLGADSRDEAGARSGGRASVSPVSLTGR